jgi:uncharacterized YccA/Bax inhibitor family protein
MAQRRIRKRQTALPTLPYWRSILTSFLLLLSMMFLFELFADPRSGELRSPGMVAPVFVLFVLVEAGVFYAEFRLREKDARPRRSDATKSCDEGRGGLC